MYIRSFLSVGIISVLLVSQSVAITETTARAPRALVQEQDEKARIIRIASYNVLPFEITKEYQRYIDNIVGHLKRDNLEEAKFLWKELIEMFSEDRWNSSQEQLSGDISALLDWLLLKGYLEEQEALRENAAKVRYYSELRKILRGYLDDLRDLYNRYMDREIRIVRVPVVPRDSSMMRIPQSQRVVLESRPGNVYQPADIKTNEVIVYTHLIETDKSGLSREVNKLDTYYMTVENKLLRANGDLNKALKKHRATVQKITGASALLLEIVNAMSSEKQTH